MTISTYINADTKGHLIYCLEYLLESETKHFIECFGGDSDDEDFFEEVDQDHVFTEEQKDHVFYHAWTAHLELTKDEHVSAN